MLKTNSWLSDIPATLAASATAATLAALAIGCGGAPTTVPPLATTTQPGSTPTAPVGSTTSLPSGNPNYSFHVQEQGQGNAAPAGSSNGGTLSVKANTSLIVAMTAGDGVAFQSGTVGFNCESFNVTIGGVTQQAFVKKQSYEDVPLANGWMSYDPCENAQTTWVYDFTSALASGGSTLTITVGSAQFDNCASLDAYDFSGVYYGGCAMSNVGLAYAVDAFLQVYTD